MYDSMTAKPAEITVINRREIEPLQLKASELMQYYEKAVGCRALVLDGSGNLISFFSKKTILAICELCWACHYDTSRAQGEYEFPCTTVHTQAISRVKAVGSYIYKCMIDLGHWISPFNAGGRFAGTLMAGQVLTVSREEAANKFCSRFRVSRNKVLDLLSEVPEKNHEEINAMARLLLLCAKKLSSGSGDRYLSIGGINSKAAPEARNELKSFPLGNSTREAWTYSREKEQALLAALRRGDKNKASEILNDLLTIIEKTRYGDFNLIRLFCIDLAVFLSRAEENKYNLEEAYYRRLTQLQESRTIEELKANLLYFIDHIGNVIFSFRGFRHASALRKAERFIWENYTRKLSLKEIAAASGLSAPYFCTIFKEEMGKKLSTYLNQLRVDRAVTMLDETSLPLNEIARACGFTDQSWFSKIFRTHKGISPGKYREQKNRGKEDYYIE